MANDQSAYEPVNSALEQFGVAVGKVYACIARAVASLAQANGGEALTSVHEETAKAQQLLRQETLVLEGLLEKEEGNTPARQALINCCNAAKPYLAVSYEMQAEASLMAALASYDRATGVLGEDAKKSLAAAVESCQNAYNLLVGSEGFLTAHNERFTLWRGLQEIFGMWATACVFLGADSYRRGDKLLREATKAATTTITTTTDSLSKPDKERIRQGLSCLAEASRWYSSALEVSHEAAAKWAVIRTQDAAGLERLLGSIAIVKSQYQPLLQNRQVQDGN